MKTSSLIKKSLVLVYVWSALMAASAAHAVLMPALYTGEGAFVEGTSVEQAQLAALDQVLFRLTGQATLREQLSIGGDEVTVLIQSQQIIERDWLDDQGQLRRIRHLKVEFDPIGLDEVLAEAQIKRWGRERVSVLAWAVIEEGFEVTLLADPSLERALSQWAQVYGLDLIRPLGDALDLAQLSITDIRGGFLDQAMPGLARYGAGVALMLDLRPEPQGWLVRAFWRIDGLDQGRAFFGQTPIHALRQALEGLLQALIDRYATDLNDQSTQVKQIRLLGMNDPVQYAEVLGYLKNLSIINTVRILEASGSDVLFEVVVQGDQLIDALAVGQTLEVVNVEPSGLIELRLK